MKGSPIPTTAPAESNGECVLVRPTFSLLDTYKSTILEAFQFDRASFYENPAAFSKEMIFLDPQRKKACASERDPPVPWAFGRFPSFIQKWGSYLTKKWKKPVSASTTWHETFPSEIGVKSFRQYHSPRRTIIGSTGHSKTSISRSRQAKFVLRYAAG